MNHLALRAIRMWKQWRLDRQFAKDNPEIIKCRREIAAARKAHKPVKPIMERQKSLMLAALKGGR